MQQLSYQELLFHILTIIGYQNNKEKFVREFELLNRLDAIASIIDTYPLSLQEKIKACRSAEELQQYVKEDAYKDSYIKVSQNALQEFVSAIAHSLSTSQKQKVVDLVS